MEHLQGPLLQCSQTPFHACIYPEHHEINEMALPDEWSFEYSLEHLFQEVNLIFIDLSWNEFALLANQIRTNIAERHVLISLNAGFSFSKLHQIMNERKQVLMIKTPLTNLSVSPVVLLFGASVESQEKDVLMQLFSNITVVKTEEELNMLRNIIEKAPFFVATLLDAICDGAWANGVQRQQAFRLAVQSIQEWFNSNRYSLSLHSMMNQQNLNSSCILTLEKHNFRYAIIDALQQIQPT